MPVICGCPKERLCDLCFEQRLYWHTGTAIFRGGFWAESVARRRPDLLGQPWPDDDKARAIAARKVADIAGDDPRVQAKLAAEVIAGAARAWASRPAGSRK